MIVSWCSICLLQYIELLDKVSVPLTGCWYLLLHLTWSRSGQKSTTYKLTLQLLYFWGTHNTYFEVPQRLARPGRDSWHELFGWSSGRLLESCLFGQLSSGMWQLPCSRMNGFSFRQGSLQPHEWVLISPGKSWLLASFDTHLIFSCVFICLKLTPKQDNQQHRKPKGQMPLGPAPAPAAA
jgi:hypothetical protein